MTITQQLLQVIPAFGVISEQEAIRLMVLYAHVILCCLAITTVLYSDLKIVTGSFTRTGLQQRAQWITRILIGLWVSGLLLITIDTGLQPDVLQNNSKLLFKVLIVSVLTLNGVILHHLSFPIITTGKPLILSKALTLSVTGSISTSHWLLAVFVGISQPLGRIPLDQLMVFYMAFVFGMLLIAIAFVPFLISGMKRWHQTVPALEAR